MSAPDAVAVEREHLVPDLRANLHTAPEPHRSLMRRAADELAQFDGFTVVARIPIHPPVESEDAER